MHIEPHLSKAELSGLKKRPDGLRERSEEREEEQEGMLSLGQVLNVVLMM